MTDELMEMVNAGMDAEVFMRSGAGKFLRDKAEYEILEATALLVQADPEDAKINRELRNRIQVANMFLQWMRDAVDRGMAAQDAIKETE